MRPQGAVCLELKRKEVALFNKMTGGGVLKTLIACNPFNMSRTWLCQYTKVKQHPKTEGAGGQRDTGPGAPSRSVILFVSFLLFLDFFFCSRFVFVCAGRGARGFAQGGPGIAPPRPVLPLAKCAGRSSGKRDDLNQGGVGGIGGSGAGPVHFCSAEKGGLFFVDHPAIFNRGLSECRARRPTRHSVGGVGWDQREEGHDVVQPAVQPQPSRAEAAEGITHFNKHT